VRLALGLKGLDAELVAVDPADRSPVVAASGQPLVPVLLDGDVVVHDSLAILRHLERKAPEPALFPADPARRAEVDVFLDWFDRVWKVAPNAIEAAEAAPEPDRERIDALARELRGSLDRFEALLGGRDFLLGELGAADLAAFPFLRYALGAPEGDDERFHAILAEGLRLDGGHPRVAAWIRRVDALPRRPTG
jgi:glutathione S-transferase